MIKRLSSFILAIVLSFGGIVSADNGYISQRSREAIQSSISFFGESARLLREQDEEEEPFYISSIKLTSGSDTMLVNGDEQNVPAPLVIDGDEFLPLVEIAEAMGAQVDINDITGDITITDDGVDRVLESPTDKDALPLFDIQEVAGLLTLDTYIDGDDIILTRPFQTKMLMVMMIPGKTLPDVYGALDYVTDGEGRYVLKYDSISQTKDAYEAIKALPNCQSIAPNLVVTASGKPSGDSITPFSLPSQNWNTERIRADLMKDYLVSTGKTDSEIIVAVLDSGADSTHPYLAGRLLPGKNFSMEHENDDKWTMDGGGHGTHVTGTIVACTPGNVKILPVKVLDDYGYGMDSDIVAGLMWAVDNGADIINLSLRCVDYDNDPDWDMLYRNACEYAVNKGVTVIAAAGNDDTDTKYINPARQPSVITVTATNQSDQKVNYSNYGDAVDVSAPGTLILSSIPNGGYAYYEGTSMAAAHISAVAAMLKLNDPGLDHEGLKTAIETMTIDLGITGWDRVYGAGVVDFRMFFNQVNIPVTQFSISPTTVSIENSLTFLRNYRKWVNISVGGIDTTDKSFTVYSSDNNIAVYVDGYIVPKGAGNAKITFRTANGLSSTCSVTVSSSSNWLDYAADEYAGGRGTSDDPYVIATPEQLAKLSYDVGIRGNLFTDQYFRLDKDIDLGGKYWIPIYYAQSGPNWFFREGFMGNFDGNYHSISNMKIIRTGTSLTSFYLGLFGEIGDDFDLNHTSSIKNLAVLNADIDGNGYINTPIGIICGCAGRGTTISNCYTTGIVSGGGLIGWGAAKITNCFSKADVFEDYPWDSVGGLALNLSSSIEGLQGSIYNSYSSGNVVTKRASPSGFIAIADGTNIINSFSTSYVPFGSGFADLKTFGTIRRCYYLDGSRIGIRVDQAANTSDLKPKDISFFLDKSNYLNSNNWDNKYPWDFENVWAIDESINEGLPYLKTLPLPPNSENQPYPDSIYVRALAIPGGSVSGSGTFTYGSKVTVVATPNEGSIFIGWFENQAIIEGVGLAYTFSATSNRLLQARFSDGVENNSYTITASAGTGGTIYPSGSIQVTEGADQQFIITADSGYVITSVSVDGESKGTVRTHTFTDVSSLHQISVTFSPIEYSPEKSVVISGLSNGHEDIPATPAPVPETPVLSADPVRYDDVDSSDWFSEAVQYVSEKGLMTGTDKSLFSPGVAMSRTMLVTVLYRLEGKPVDSMYLMDNETPFRDVVEGAWYYDAVMWAAENSIVGGYGDGLFGIGDPITREQTVTILYRYAKAKGLNTGAVIDLSSYSDADDISDWAMDELQWAVAVGIIQGRTPTTAAPKGTSTRAEVAAIIMRYIEGFLTMNNGYI